MNAIETLQREHDLILEFLGQLSTAVERIVTSQGPPKEYFEKALDFCRVFADQYHHFKEEYVMFGLLAQKHDGALDGEIARHRDQHEECRTLIQKTSQSLDGYSRKLDTAARTIHRSMSDYVITLRSHIRSENEILFPMVEEALSQEEAEGLLKEFAAYEAKTGSDTYDRYRERVDELTAML